MPRWQRVHAEQLRDSDVAMLGGIVCRIPDPVVREWSGVTNIVFEHDRIRRTPISKRPRHHVEHDLPQLLGIWLVVDPVPESSRVLQRRDRETQVENSVSSGWKIGHSELQVWVRKKMSPEGLVLFGCYFRWVDNPLAMCCAAWPFAAALVLNALETNLPQL